MTDFARLSQLATREQTLKRKRQADALRALRLVDKAAAKFILKWWKEADEVSRAVNDLVVYGHGFVQTTYVPPSDFFKEKECPKSSG